jgi:hypothetical protein
VQFVWRALHKNIFPLPFLPFRISDFYNNLCSNQKHEITLIKPVLSIAKIPFMDSIPRHPCQLQNWSAWKAGGALASEMESAALFTVAATRRVRCATILQMLWNQEREQVIRDNSHAANDMHPAIEVAMAAMKATILEDKGA